MRRLPIYFVIDVSESMAGEQIGYMQDGMATMIAALRSDPYALETCYVSVIAFAGKAKKLLPLTELPLFYPPKLPIGGGTSLGAALEFLMHDLDCSIQKTTAETKGDWKPIIFLMTDGNPTDDYQSAFNKWNNSYRRRSSMVAITLDGADARILGKLTENVVGVRTADAAAYKSMFKWVTASIKTNSVGINESSSDELRLAPMTDDNVQKIDLEKHMPTKIDDNFAVILAKCQTTEQKYLIKYKKQHANAKKYCLCGTFPLDNMYDELSQDMHAAGNVNTEALEGYPTCPCCSNQYGLNLCNCGGVHCISDMGIVQTCPWCGNQSEYYPNRFDISRTKG